MTDYQKKPPALKRKTKDSLADTADRLVESMANNLAEAYKLDSEELDRLEDEKNKRLDKALAESEEEE